MSFLEELASKGMLSPLATMFTGLFAIGTVLINSKYQLKLTDKKIEAEKSLKSIEIAAERELAICAETRTKIENLYEEIRLYESAVENLEKKLSTKNSIKDRNASVSEKATFIVDSLDNAVIAIDNDLSRLRFNAETLASFYTRDTEGLFNELEIEETEIRELCVDKSHAVKSHIDRLNQDEGEDESQLSKMLRALNSPEALLSLLQDPDHERALYNHFSAIKGQIWEVKELLKEQMRELNDLE